MAKIKKILRIAAKKIGRKSKKFFEPDEHSMPENFGI